MARRETDNSTLTFEPGRDLDALIAAKIFGIKKIHYFEGDTEKHYPQFIPSGKSWRTHQIDAQSLPEFSTSIGAAWIIVEHLLKEGKQVTIRALTTVSQCEVVEGILCVGISSAPSTAHAICLASLDTVEALPASDD